MFLKRYFVWVSATQPRLRVELLLHKSQTTTYFTFDVLNINLINMLWDFCWFNIGVKSWLAKTWFEDCCDCESSIAVNVRQHHPNDFLY